MDNDTDGIPEVTLGEILAEEFLQPMGISAYRPAKDTAVPATRISEILRGRGRITAETALRLSAYFGNSAEFRLGIQDEYKYLQIKSIYYRISLHPKGEVLMDKTIFTGRQPSFLNGMARTVDIFGTLNTCDESDNARISNAKAIGADCLAVMDDSVMSVEQFEDSLG